jgi:hypothetical protein
MKRIFDYSETYLLIAFMFLSEFRLAVNIMVVEKGTWQDALITCLFLQFIYTIFGGLVWRITTRYYADKIMNKVIEYYGIGEEKKDGTHISKHSEGN